MHWPRIEILWTKLTLLALIALGVFLTVLLAIPAFAAPKTMLSGPAAALRPNSLTKTAGPFLPAEPPEVSPMLAAGCTLMALGLMGRKRRAEKASMRPSQVR